MERKIKILGMGKYLPQTIVTSEEIDEKLGLTKGWTEKKSGVKERHYAKGESASEMGAKAVKQALINTGITLDEIDCIVSTSGTMEQPIPCTASLIHEQLKPKKPIPAFDINATCLSFVTGLDVLSHLVHNGVYKKVLLVATEIASIGINPKQKESYVLFGDAAVACVIGKSDERSALLTSKMNTYSEGAHMTEIRGGGTKLPPYQHPIDENFLFDMDGRGVFKLSLREINPFLDGLFKETNLTMEDIDLVVPHQASGMAMRIMRNKLNVPKEKFMDVIDKYGNTIASSIPLALHDAIESGRIKRGDKVMMLGTSAGLSIGGIVLEY